MRISSLSMNGKDIPVTEEGNFSEPYLLASGDNHITLQAKDTYGRTTTSDVDIIYEPEPGGVAPAASTSTTTPI